VSDPIVAEDPVGDFLEHIGVKGMKWGVKRGKGSKVFKKAAKKAIRLEKRASKLTRRGAKLQYKGAKWGNFAKMRKGMRLSYKGSAKAEKLRKWELQMAKHLKDVKVSELDYKHKEAGKQYLHMLRGDVNGSDAKSRKVVKAEAKATAKTAKATTGTSK
jgi:hypothetical protein